MPPGAHRVNEESTVPFFPDEEAARDYLERRAETGKKEQYEYLSLSKARTRKVRDAVDGFTDQSEIEDFVQDGGMQIDNPAPDRIGTALHELGHHTGSDDGHGPDWYHAVEDQ